LNTENRYYFNLLKQVVTTTFLKEHAVSSKIEDWKGEDIVLFQEDLFAKVKAKVSEKWFYTYFKNEAENLPRVDMLNLLSEYVGFSNWNMFKTAHKTKIKVATKTKNPIYWLLIILPILSFIIFWMTKKNEFHFCFVDDIKNEAITKIPLDVKIIQKQESPIYLKTDSLGCFSYKTKENLIKFVVQSPYHKTDTIVRSIDSNTNKTVKLTTDDYALMLHYYTNGNVKDWKKHKQQLSNIIADNALIYQLYQNNINVELYTKDDFIRLLTIPTSSLKKINILDKTLEHGKIVKLKFMMK
jgi:hypothetical protein